VRGLARAAGAREWLDREVPAAEREAALADIDRLNAWFGGYRLTLARVARLARRAPADRPLVVLDVGGGRGDFARRLLAWGRRIGRPLRVLVVDRHAAPRPGVRAVRADAAALPFRPGAVDVATCTLTLHHLEPDDAARCLAEMRAVARLGLVVNDLLRTRLTLALVWLVTRLARCHRYCRHDGPLSVRRAYAPEELVALAGKAGLPRLRVRRYPLLGRLVAEAEG